AQARRQAGDGGVRRWCDLGRDGDDVDDAGRAPGHGRCAAGRGARGGVVKLAFLFPGQGAQAVGMGKALADSFPEARDVFATADRVLGYPLSDVCWNGPAEELKKSVHTQPALLTHSVAALRLEVSGAFHSPLMEPAVAGFTAALASVTLRDARCPVVVNAWAKPVQKAAELRRALEEQLLASVRWEDSMRFLLTQGGVEAF